MTIREQITEIRMTARAATGNGHKAGTDYVWQYQAIRLCDALEEAMKHIGAVTGGMTSRTEVYVLVSAILNGKEPPHAEHS